MYSDRIDELRKKINEKCASIGGLTEHNHFLLEERDSDLKSFDEQLNHERRKFEEMKEKLSCDIKVLNSKLNNLEEFRAEREGLIEKHLIMQNYLKDLEERAAGIVHVYQRLELINRDRMGQELKDRLLKLSIEFQEASQTETTRSLIRENIAINNELGGHIGSWQALHDENRELKERKRLLAADLRSEETLKEKCLSLNVLQTQVIERLAYEHKKLDMFHEETKSLQDLTVRLGKKLETLTTETTAAELEANLLIQEKHNLMTRVNELEHDCTVLSNVIYEEEINLKKALLYVAEGKDLQIRKERLKLTNEGLRNRLVDILRKLKILLKDTRTSWTEDMAQEQSVGTICDLDYAEKYWRGLGIIIERRLTKKPAQDKEATPVKEDSDSEDSD